MARNSITTVSYGESMVTYKGVSMTSSEYKKMIRENKLKKALENGEVIKKPKRRTKVLTEIQYQSIDIKTLTNGVKLLKSFDNFYHRVYKDWGCEARDIIYKTKDINKFFVKFISKYKDIQRQIDLIESIGMKSDKSVYQYMEQLSYYLDDMVHILTDLSKSISKNCILDRFKDKPFVNSVGKRLGLRELMSRVYSSVQKMQTVIRRCGFYGSNGLNPFEYVPQTTNNILNVCIDK